MKIEMFDIDLMFVSPELQTQDSATFVGCKLRIAWGSNNRKPDKENAAGDHSVIDKNGNTTYKENPKNPSGFDEVKRTDVKGKAHTNTNGTKVETPHVHEKGQKDVRPAVKGQDY